MALQRTVAEITDKVRSRSEPTRSGYLRRVEQARATGTSRGRISCTNLAHAFAAEAAPDKLVLREIRAPNIGIVSAYNDMLSAHQPLARFPISSNAPRGTPAPRPSSLAACPQCAMA